MGYLPMKAKINKVTIHLVEGDILTLLVHGLVLDSNVDLLLSDDLAQMAGGHVQRELFEIGYCDVGSAVITSAGDLPFQKLIHAVGPRWGEGSERGKLMTTIQDSLHLAEQHKLKSVAFPAISTGKNGYPIENCAHIMLENIVDYTFEELRSLRTIYICLKDDLSLQIFKREFTRQIESLRANDEGQVRI